MLKQLSLLLVLFWLCQTHCAAQDTDTLDTNNPETIDSFRINHPERGFTLMVNGGIMMLFNKGYDGIVGNLELIGGYRFTRHFSMGFDLNIEFPNASRPNTYQSTFHLPLMLHLAFDLPDYESRFVPFVRLDLGGRFSRSSALAATPNSDLAGFAGQVGVGIKTRIAHMAYINLNLNYMLQTGRTQYFPYYLHFLVIRLGYSF